MAAFLLLLAWQTLGTLALAAAAGWWGHHAASRRTVDSKHSLGRLAAALAAAVVAMGLLVDGPDVSSLLWHLAAAALGGVACWVWVNRRRFGWSTLLCGLGGATSAMLILFLLLSDGRPEVIATFVDVPESRNGLRRLVKDLPEGAGPWELVISPEEATILAESSLAARNSPMAVRVEIKGDTVLLLSSIPAGRLGDWVRYVNLQWEFGASVDSGRPVIDPRRFRTGMIAWPRFLLQRVVRGVEAWAAGQERANRIAALVDEIRVADGQVHLAGTNAPLLRRLVIQGLHGDQRRELDPRVIGEYVEELVSVSPDLPRGDARFLGLLRAALGHAARRASESSPEDENRCALVAVAVLIGDNHVGTLTGVDRLIRQPVMPYEFRKVITLRGRRDLAQHFAVSAALTAISTSRAADAAGFLKEHLDALPGGSGFSFADLAADRAGVQFAVRGTRDAGSASWLQSRLSGDVSTDDVLPSLDGLGEGLGIVDMQAEFGSFEDERFLTILRGLDARIAQCPLYR